MNEEPNLIEGGTALDDRGSLTFCNDFDFKEKGIRRFYQVENLSTDIIRGFHGHISKEEKYVFVSKGIIKIVTVPIIKEKRYDEEGNQIEVNALNVTAVKTFILSSKKPQILYIPKGYAHGFKCLEKGTIILFFSTSTLEESKNDDYRFSFDSLGMEIWECKNR